MFQAEIDETVRKSTNILLTRTLSGCLSTLIRRDNLSLLQLIQVLFKKDLECTAPTIYI